MGNCERNVNFEIVAKNHIKDACHFILPWYNVDNLNKLRIFL